MLSQSASHAVLLGATRQESELVEMSMSNIPLWRLPVKFHIGAELPDENPTLTAAKPHIGGPYFHTIRLKVLLEYHKTLYSRFVAGKSRQNQQEGEYYRNMS